MAIYQEESYLDVIDEIKPLLEKHYHEIALDQDWIKLNPDYVVYERMSRVGSMCIVTAREEGKLIGYCITFIKQHLHYKDLKVGANDIFFIDPAYRKGMTGIKLFKHTEKILKDKGVQKMVMNVKLHRDVGKIFEHLGYTEIERIYTKTIG